MAALVTSSRNRTRRQLRARVDALVQGRIGAGVICPRCSATLASYADKCTADLDERCPGFIAIELETRRAEQEMGLR